ncbi:hypothetical protein PQR53_38075 [Paraburkholderia fungorum]|uniref:Kelch repeat-containing protein n=1 Tax=Paraburkholderia fungorum TaxID=134537 RepID=UPI0038B970CC
MHVIGGYGAGQVARAYHHVFDAARAAWFDAAPIPRGANHIGVAAQDGVIHAMGGFVEQNRIATPDCYAYVVADDRWHAVRPLSRGSRGAISVVAANGLIHAIGGRDTRSVDWHEAYDPRTDTWHVGGEGTRRVFGQTEAYDPLSDSWEAYATMLTPRHGMGTAVIADAIHVAGGGPMNGGAFQTSIHEVLIA